ncbi:hypothetical protein FRUB_06854 [Fimbriiglobus ruber]|uniref:Uncharacterized protein n=1 Tax=Fimbriiglobus ruber TaxID=1908690 RepID=A0A225DDM0_9BACT|nr:hypothetical protein FRUB_06854 [Fimbriiglobus ruber]
MDHLSTHVAPVLGSPAFTPIRPPFACRFRNRDITVIVGFGRGPRAEPDTSPHRPHQVS